LALLVAQGFRFGGGSGAGALLDLNLDFDRSSSGGAAPKVAAADACGDVEAVLGATLPVLEERLLGLGEGGCDGGFDGGEALTQVKTHVSEAVAFGLVALVARSAAASEGSYPEPTAIGAAVPSFVAFAHSVAEMRDALLAEPDAPPASASAGPLGAGPLGEGPWRSRLDWLVAVAHFLSQPRSLDVGAPSGDNTATAGPGGAQNLVAAHFKLCDAFRLDPTVKIHPPSWRARRPFWANMHGEL
jgi:hypothetical protein